MTTNAEETTGAEDLSDDDWSDAWPDDPPHPVAVDLGSPRRKTIAAMLAAPMLLAVTLLLSIPLMVVESPDLVVYALVTDLAFVLVMMWALWFTGQQSDWRNALLFRRPPVRWMFIAVAFGLAWQLVLGSLDTWLESRGLGVAESSTIADVEVSAGAGRIIVLCAIVPLLAPLVEESFFRGYVFGFLSTGSWSQKSRRVGLVAAIALSSLFFALMHFQSSGADGSVTFGDWILMGCLFGFAVVNALLVWRTRSIFVPVAAHAAFNLLPAVGIALGL